MASTSTFISSRSYDVFLSFRGKDTRTNFTDHLYTSLVAKGIHTFREDEELERGGVITPELLKAIEKSKISIIIFSENYASSRWCLDEVEKIMECRIEMNRRVSPVFYHVDPSDVRKQMESYGEAFIQHEKDADQEKSEKIKRWRTALSEVGSLSGWHVHDQYESKIIREITSDVLRKLNQKIFHVGEHIVGMNYRLRTLLSLINNIQLNDIPVVGIYGYGGIGKTTIAKAICNEISYQFESISFLENVRERSKASFGMLQLQEQLLDDVLMGMKRKKISSIGQGINVIKERVSSKKVLIVLDDVNDLDQLKALAGNHSWFGLGSIIIITTRNKHLLRAHGVNKLYEPSGLTNEDAIQLFSWNAFKTNRPIPKTCALLSRRVVVYARGLPLALKVFGSFLFGKTNAQWESALAKLKEKPNNEVQDVLEISYDGLDDMEKDIFLDIACFFKGQSEDFATRILDGCNFHAKVGMRVLSDRCLITLSNDIIGMHDLLQEMCWKIVCQTSPKEPGKWSRLWDPEDIYQVLTTNTGTQSIEGIILDLDMPKSKQIEFTTEAFKMMRKLRLLKVHQDAKYDAFHLKAMTAPKVHFSRDFEFPSYELRYLHWDGYPLESLPSNFHGEELVEVTFRSSNIKQLFLENKIFEKLKVIDLSHSRHLIEIPNISNAPNLEILNLEWCENLENLPSGICELKCLTTLRCTHCTEIKIFPEIKKDMERLRELHLDYTSIQELPSSVKRLKGLEDLNLFCCESLSSLPDSICNLRSLKTLNIGRCWNVKKLPENLDSLQCLERFHAESVSCQLPSLSRLCPLKALVVSHSNLRQGAILSDISCFSSLEKLDLSYCNLVEGEIPTDICHLSMLKWLNLSGNHFSRLPARISQLSKLRVLGLSHCKMLQEIPELPSSLRDIEAHDCACLETLSSPPSLLWKGQLWCSLFNCFKSEVQDLEWRNSLSMAEFDCFFYNGKGISIVMPGSCGIPEEIRNENMGSKVTIERHRSEVTIELPMNWHEDKNLLGFVLCSLYVPVRDELEYESEEISQSELDDENESEEKSQSELDDENESGEKSESEPNDGSDDERVPGCLLACKLSIDGVQIRFKDSLLLNTHCDCYENDASDQVWLLYYPKICILAQDRSNQWRNLKVKFYSSINKKVVKVGGCGVGLIYSLEDESAAADTNVNIKRSHEKTTQLRTHKIKD